MINPVAVTSITNTVSVLSVNFNVSIVYYPNLETFEVFSSPFGKSEIIYSGKSARRAVSAAKSIDDFLESCLEDFLDLSGWY